MGYLGLLVADDFFSVRTSLLNAFFGSTPVWASCAGDAYQAKASSLHNQVNALAGETDQIKQWDLERAISQTLEDCR